MSETRTLHFDNARQLQSLYANDLKLLKSMEESLGVKVTTRKGWVKLEGEPEKIDKAERVFNQLEEDHDLAAQTADCCEIEWPKELRRSDRQTRYRFWNRTGGNRQNLSRCRD